MKTIQRVVKKKVDLTNIEDLEVPKRKKKQRTPKLNEAIVNAGWEAYHG